MITLDHVIPIPLSDQIADSQIWGKRFDLDTSKRYFIEAPSGKGKTTLQHILFGLRKDYKGQVLINGKSTTNFGLEEWATLRQKELSVVFQDLRLFPDLTSIENILLKNKLTDYKTLEQIQTMAVSLEVDMLLDKKCGEMSYGQRQRIAIIRALCQPFQFLLMDEPFAHLDSANVQKCCQLIMQEAAAQQAGYAIASLEERYLLEYDLVAKI